MADIAYLGSGGRRPRPLLRTLVGEVLRRHRQEQGRTLAEVAREACVSMPYLSEVERGRKEPSSEILAAVCDSLRIELSDLLAEVPRSDRLPPRFRLTPPRAAAIAPARHPAPRAVPLDRAATPAGQQPPVPARRHAASRRARFQRAGRPRRSPVG